MDTERWRHDLGTFEPKFLDRGRRVMAGERLDRVLNESRGLILVTPEAHPASEARASRRTKTDDPEGPAVLVAAVGEAAPSSVAPKACPDRSTP